MKDNLLGKLTLLSLLLFFVCSSFNTSAQGSGNIYITTTDCSAYGVCDGTVTVWVSGASVTDSFQFIIQAVGQGYVIDTLVQDTIITITGLCVDTYNTDLYLPGCSPNYGCCNCTGGSCAGNGGGASGAVGGPGPSLDFWVDIYCADQCNFFPGYMNVVITGQAPPFLVDFGYGFSPSTSMQVYCDLIPASNYISVMDATGQVVTYDNPYMCPYCGLNAILDQIPTVEVCAGETIGLIDFNSFLQMGWMNTTSGIFSWTNNNTATGIPASSPFPSEWSPNNSFLFTAANVTSTQVSTITLTSNVWYSNFTNICYGNTIQFDVIVHPPPNVNAGNDLAICSGDPVTLSGSGANSYTWDQGVQNGVSFVPSATANYTVTGTDNFGCTNSDQVNVSILTPQIIDAGMDQTICEGDQLTLFGTGGTNYSWNNGILDNVPFTPPLGTTTYEVTTSAGSGCESTDQVDVTVVPLPTIGAGIDQTVCEGNQITLSGTGGVSYSWNNGISDNVAFSQALGTTMYEVTGTDVNGCQNTDQVDVIVSTLPIIDGGPNQTICEGDQITLSASGGMSYVWDNGVVDGIGFTPVNGVTTYSVTGTDANGCQNTDQVDLVINPLPIIDAGMDQSLCDGDQLTLSGSGGMTYAWDNGVLDGVSFTPTPAVSTYSVVGTDANGCQSSDQIDITVNLLPTIDAGTDQTICVGNQVTLSGSGGVSYVWDNGVTDNTPFSASLGTTTYEVIGTDANGCQNTDQVDVALSSPPIIDAGLDQTICEGDQITLSGSGGTSYTWNNGVSDNVVFTPIVGTNTYEVTGIDANGCQNTDQVDVIVNPLPNIDAGTNQTVCDGDQIMLSGSGGTSYVWDNGILDGIPFTPTLGNTTYEVMGTDLNGCQNIDQIDVTVNALPIVNAGPDQTICEGDQVTLFASGGAGYVWDNGVIDGNPFSPPVGITNYTVAGTSSSGCSNTDEVIITTEPVPTVSFIGSPLEGCSPLDIELTNTTTGTSVDCIWTISGGITLNGCGTVTTQLTEPGYYDVTLMTTTLGGCFSSETYTDYIYIEPDPIAAFTFPTSEFTTLNSEVQFTNLSSGASSYWWEFNDNSFGTNEIHPLHNFPEEASSYIIDLTAYSDLGCIDSASASISIKEELIYYVPNSFSPDGDEYNNVFEPVFHSGFDPFSFELLIFNRWGEVIFQSNDAATGWDGTYLGRMMQDGVYTWSIKFKIKDNDEYIEDRGHLNLIR